MKYNVFGIRISKNLQYNVYMIILKPKKKFVIVIIILIDCYLSLLI